VNVRVLICHGLLLCIGAQMLLLPNANACPFETFADSPHLRILQTDWIIDTWGQACGFGISGGMEIRAVNEKTHQMDTIVTLTDITIVELTSEEPNLLIIKLPNLVDISSSTTQVGNVRIAYKFTPVDDPARQSESRRSAHGPTRTFPWTSDCVRCLGTSRPVMLAASFSESDPFRTSQLLW
jgi:hypothetical protein